MKKEKINNNYIKRYNEGESFWSIAKAEKKTYKQIYEAVLGKRFEARYLPQEEKEKICEMYLNGKSTVAIGKEYGVWNKSIAVILEEKGIPRNGKQFIRKHTLNEYYFDNIDTEQKAYILGLFFADGNNCKQKSTVRIQLQEKDKQILEDIRRELNYSKPLSYVDCSHRIYGNNYISSNMFSLDIYSSHMCNRLEEIGMVPNKSLVLTFPDCIDRELLPHFLRGYIDGDGHISEKSYVCNFISTKSFCLSVQSLVYNITGLWGNIKEAPCHNGVTMVYEFTAKKYTKPFLDYIYKNATIYLERKYNIYKNHYCDINNSLLA